MWRRPAAPILFPRQNLPKNEKKRLLSGRGTGSNKKAVKPVGTREGPRLIIGLFSFLSRYSFPATGEGRQSKSFFVIFVRWGFFPFFPEKRRILAAARPFLKTPHVCRFPAHHKLARRLRKRAPLIRGGGGTCWPPLLLLLLLRGASAILRPGAARAREKLRKRRGAG